MSVADNAQLNVVTRQSCQIVNSHHLDSSARPARLVPSTLSSS